MNEPELAGPALVAAIALSAPFLLLALRAANQLLPARATPRRRWSLVEVMAVVVTPLAVFGILAAFGPIHGLLQALLANELAFGAGAAVAIGLAARHEQGLASLGFAGVVPRAFLAVPLVFVPLYFVSMGLGAGWVRVCRAQGWEESQEILRLILALEGRELVVAALVAVVLGPLLEELLFRGFLQAALEPVAGRRGALLVTSALFAALHGMAGLPVLFLLSLFLGWLQQRTRCLLVSWSAHALNNAVSLALALWLGGG